MNQELLAPKFIVHKMSPNEYVQKFDCGDADLNDFILNDAQDYRKAKLAITYTLALENDPNHVVAYCSLANDRISLNDFDNNTEFNRFRKKQGFPQTKRIKSYPAVKICRLGVDLSMRGLSAGSRFLDFIKTYFTLDNKTGCRFITVDAYIDAIPFYEKNGFRFLSSNDENATHTRTMFFDLNEIPEFE